MGGKWGQGKWGRGVRAGERIVVVGACWAELEKAGQEQRAVRGNGEGWMACRRQLGPDLGIADAPDALPVAAKLVARTEDYRWSNYRSTAGFDLPPLFLETDWILSRIRSDRVGTPAGRSRVPV